MWNLDEMIRVGDQGSPTRQKISRQLSRLEQLFQLRSLNNLENNRPTLPNVTFHDPSCGCRLMD